MSPISYPGDRLFHRIKSATLYVSAFYPSDRLFHRIKSATLYVAAFYPSDCLFHRIKSATLYVSAFYLSDHLFQTVGLSLKVLIMFSQYHSAFSISVPVPSLATRKLLMPLFYLTTVSISLVTVTAYAHV